MMMTHHVGVEIVELDLFEVHYNYTNCFFAMMSFLHLLSRCSVECLSSLVLVFSAVDVLIHHVILPTNNLTARCH